MAPVHFSDEILMAFADAELEGQVAASVEQTMARDPIIASRVVGFLRSRRMARSALHEEAETEIPPELRAAVLAQVEHFERQGQQRGSSDISLPKRITFAGRWRLGLAMAASIATLTVGTLGYLVGRRSLSPFAIGPIASLSTPEVSRALNEGASGQDQTLPFGRMRVISTFRMADGSLCREFKLHVSSGASDTVACHFNGWQVTFAVVSTATNQAYIPSDGSDLMASYLQSAGAGEPLLDTAELQALREIKDFK